MAKCAITGVHRQFGHSRSFSLRTTNRSWKPNLQKRRMMIDGRMQSVMVSVRALKTMAKAR